MSRSDDDRVKLQLVNGRKWRVVIDGVIVADDVSHSDIVDYAISKKPKSELLERYGQEVRR